MTTKLTAKIYGPAFDRLNNYLNEALIKRDAFLDRVIAQEIPHLREDLNGLRLSDQGRRYISQELGRMGGRDTGLKQVSIAIRKQTADDLRDAVEAHNLVRDSFLSLLVVLLVPKPQTLQILGFKERFTNARELSAADAATSPLESIVETMADPFHYFRSQCVQEDELGLYRKDFSVLHVGLSCYLPDEEVPGTAAHSAREDISLEDFF
jgi:hypothetical protein